MNGRIVDRRCRASQPPRILLLLVLSLLAACGGAAPNAPGAKLAAARQPATLRVGLVPSQAPETIRARYEPFRRYLSNTLGLPVELFVASDYAGVVEAMASNRLDLAYFGGVAYVQAEQRAQVVPIVTEVDRDTHTTKYYSVIIANAQSTIRTTGEIKGRKFAVGTTSTQTTISR
jgi:phosphonate transport system substrate-binding protein